MACWFFLRLNLRILTVFVCFYFLFYFYFYLLSSFDCLLVVVSWLRVYGLGWVVALLNFMVSEWSDKLKGF